MKKQLLFILLFLMSACTTTGIAQKNNKLPKWVTQPYDSYKKVDYLLAIGDGADAQSAQNSAMMNLSRIFQSDIQADQRLMEEINEVSKNGKLASVDASSSLVNTIRIGTQQQIKNAKILESFTDKTGRVTVLAGIERKPTARLYQSEIDKNEIQIAELESKSNEENNPVRKLARISEAFVLAKLNQKLASQREIILERPAEGLETESYKRVKESLEQQKRVTKVFIDDSSISKELQTAIIESFQKEGFEVSNSPADAALSAKVEYQTEAIDLGRSDAEFVKWTLSINVLDSYENRSFLTWQAESRDGSRTQKEAFIRAEFNAKKQVSKSFGKKLSTQFLGY